jgi:hypothetical protein
MIEVTGNNGPGIYALDNIDLETLKVSQNRKGPGIQSLRGSITSGEGQPGDVNEVNDNCGPGILTGSGPTFRTRQNYTSDGVRVLTHLDIRNKAGWGVLAERGSVFLNYEKASAKTTSVTGNGDLAKRCYYIDLNGRLLLQAGAAQPGGVGAGAGEVQAYLLEVIGHPGVGVAASRDISIDTGRLRKNGGGNLQAGSRISLTDVDQDDPDADNVSDESEAGAPNNGDGNRDGIPDNQQNKRDCGAWPGRPAPESQAAFVDVRLVARRPSHVPVRRCYWPGVWD